MSALFDRVAAVLGTRFGRPIDILGSAPLGGGCINDARRLSTSAGDFFLKSNNGPGAFFTAEAAGLEAMRASPTELVIPEVLAAEDPTNDGPGFLVTTLLEPTGRRADFDVALGRGLAALHRTTHATFGFDGDTYCGSSVQPNARGDRWVPFYRIYRLEHQVLLGGKCYDRSDRAIFERLFVRLEDRLGDDEPPALIHGDLWSGNLMVSGADPALIDPATYYAHREAELGMMTLFGGFSTRVFDAYDEAFPLAHGWRERNPLYQLYHLMNHATLFGGRYVEQAIAVARRFA